MKGLIVLKLAKPSPRSPLPVGEGLGVRVLVLTLGLLGSASVQAQITINSGQIPQHVGDTFMFKKNTDTAIVSVGSPGGPHNWVFDTATYAGKAQFQAVVDAHSTPFSALFPTANLAYATQGDTTMIAAFTFYLLDAQRSAGLGMGLQFTDTLLHELFAPPQLVEPFPTTYGQTWHSDFFWYDTIGTITMSTEVRERWRVDGWGTVTVPVGSYSCLRLNEQDTTIATMYVSGVPIYQDSLWYRFYAWLVPNLGMVATARSLDRDTDMVFTSSNCYRVMVHAKAGIAELGRRETRDAIQVAPNPFSQAARISFSCSRSGPARVRIYDRSGRLVKTLSDDILGIGSFSATWNGTNQAGKPAAPGVYFCRLAVPGQTLSKELVLTR